jgi:hypothetical protein
MNFDKILFGFFILLALTLNLSFVMGNYEQFGNPDYHDVWVLYAAIVVNIIATVLKLGDRSQIGAFLLATSLVANLQLIAAAAVWGIMTRVLQDTDISYVITSVVALASGAVIANLVSAVLLLIETANLRD